MYLEENRVYPTPGMTITGPLANGTYPVFLWPYDIDIQLVNSVDKYLNAPIYDVGTGTPDASAYNLPALPYTYPTLNQLNIVLKCPEVVDAYNGQDVNPGKAKTPGGGFYTFAVCTGYSYFGDMTNTTFLHQYNPTVPPSYVAPPGAMYVDNFFHPEDIGTEKHRGVLWADWVWYYGTGNVWHFSHGRNGLTGTAGTSAIRGQHAAYTDGSVQFNRLTGSSLGQTASLLANSTMGYSNTAYFWATIDHH